MAKKKNISDQEMIRTFNCGVGFCVISNKKKYFKNKKYFLNNLCLMKLVISLKIKKQSKFIQFLKW